MSDHVAPADTAELLAASVAREEQLHVEIVEMRRENKEVYDRLAVAHGARLTMERERDAAEDRFVKLREEHSDLEQEMADLRQELLREKSLNGAANVRTVARMNTGRIDRRLAYLCWSAAGVSALYLLWKIIFP